MEGSESLVRRTACIAELEDGGINAGSQGECGGRGEAIARATRSNGGAALQGGSTGIGARGVERHRSRAALDEIIGVAAGSIHDGGVDGQPARPDREGEGASLVVFRENQLVGGGIAKCRQRRVGDVDGMAGAGLIDVAVEGQGAGTAKRQGKGGPAVELKNIGKGAGGVGLDGGGRTHVDQAGAKGAVVSGDQSACGKIGLADAAGTISIVRGEGEGTEAGLGEIVSARPGAVLDGRVNDRRRGGGNRERERPRLVGFGERESIRRGVAESSAADVADVQGAVTARMGQGSGEAEIAGALQGAVVGGHCHGIRQGPIAAAVIEGARIERYRARAQRAVVADHQWA